MRRKGIEVDAAVEIVGEAVCRRKVLRGSSGSQQEEQRRSLEIPLVAVL